MTPKRRGRRALDENDPSRVAVHVQLPSKVYDRVYAQASAERRTVPEIIRRAMRESREKSKGSS